MSINVFTQQLVSKVVCETDLYLYCECISYSIMLYNVRIMLADIHSVPVALSLCDRLLAARSASALMVWNRFLLTALLCMALHNELH